MSPDLPTRKASRRNVRCALALALGLAALALRAVPARAFEFLDGKVQLHGYVEEQLRMVSDGFRQDRWFFSQWANVMNLELEIDLAKDGWGPFDSISSFTRGEVRFDCIWSSACGLSQTTKIFGNRADRVPGNYANGVTSGYTGVLPTGQSKRIHNTNNNLIPFYQAPPLDGLSKLGANNLEQTFGPVLNAAVAVKKLEGSLGPITLPQGPWYPELKIRPIGALSSVPNVTGPLPPQTPLPLRPAITTRISASGRLTVSTRPPRPCCARWTSTTASIRTSPRSSCSGITARARARPAS